MLNNLSTKTGEDQTPAPKGSRSEVSTSSTDKMKPKNHAKRVMSKPQGFDLRLKNSCLDCARYDRCGRRGEAVSKVCHVVEIGHPAVSILQGHSVPAIRSHSKLWATSEAGMGHPAKKLEPTRGFQPTKLEGKCYVQLSGTTGPNIALVQIDEEEGGGSQFPYYTLAGLGGYVNSNESYFPVYVTRVYWKQQGIHYFRMEGRANHAPPAQARSWDHVLTATYYPTSYGVVSKVSTSPDGHPNAVPLDITDPQDPTGRSRFYQMDLRYFEQQAKENDTVPRHEQR